MRFLLGTTALLAVGACSFETHSSIPLDERAARRVAIHHEQRTLEGFPMLVALDATTLEFQRARADGSDLRFFDVNGALLPHEIETWTDSSATVWVKAPTLLGGQPTYIMLEYGGEPTVAPMDPSAVWSDGFAAVWHMDGTEPVRDSTAGRHTGRVASAPEWQGDYGGSLVFDGVDDAVTVLESDAMQVVDMTLEAWVRYDGPGETPAWASIVEHARETPNWYGLWKTNGRPTFHFRWSAGDERADFVTPFLPGKWHYVAGVFDSSIGSATLYLDGLPDSTVTANAPSAAEGALHIGRVAQDGEFFQGAIGEVRINSVARNADWISAQASSMRGEFVTVGALDLLPQ